MKAHKTTIQLTTRWGYCSTPETFPSKRQALEHARWMINNGFAWAYTILKEERV